MPLIVFNRQMLNVGSFPNSGDGDILRDASIKLNNNLTELFDAVEVVDTALDSKVDVVVGETLTPNKFTNAYRTKLDNAESVTGAQTKATTAENNANTYTDTQISTVQSDVNTRALISETGYQLTKDEGTSTIYLRDKNNNILSTLSVSFLNNEGTVLNYNGTTEEIELKDDGGNILSKFPTSALVSGVGDNINLNGTSIELRDSSNNVLSTSVLGIANVSGLQTELDAKETITNVDTKVATAETNAIDWAKQWGLGVDAPNFDGDLNTISVTSFKYASVTSTNRPSANGGWVITITQDSLFSTQTFYDSNASSASYFRVKINGTWQAWIEMESVTGAQTKATTAENNAKTYADTQLSTKVDKDGTKQLSDENYTTAEKNIVANAESVTGAQAKADAAEQAAKGYADTGDAALQTQIDNINSGTGFVDTTTDQTIGGIKTFTNNTQFNSNITVTGTISEGGTLLSSKYETPTGAQTKATTAENNAKTYADTQLSTKVDKDGTKQLSDENYTTSDKNLLYSLKTDSYFQYVQPTPSATWNINHNLNKRPSVTVTDSSGNVVIGQVSYVDTNNLTVTFNAGFTGQAELN